MKVAITGATGHLGGLVIRELHRQGHSIHALVRGKIPDIFDGIPIKFITGDLGNLPALKELMYSCDALIHSAALISIHGDQHGLVHKTNVEGTRNVMEAAIVSGIKRVIHISSIHAFRQQPFDEVLDEESSKVGEEAFAYDRSKIEGEKFALGYASDHMTVLVMNPTSIIGPHDYKPSRMGKVILDLCSGNLPFVIHGGFDFCDGRDVAKAICNALTMGRNGHNYLLSGQWYPIKEIAVQLSKITNRKINVFNLPSWIAWLGLPFIYMHGWLKKEEPIYTNEALAAITEGNRKISSQKAKNELQYDARTLEETLRDTVQWFLENGYLGDRKHSFK